MIDRQIELISAKIASAPNLPESTKNELLELLSTLRQEVNTLADPETANSIAGFANVSAHEGTRADRKPELLDSALKGLGASVQELEATHPKLFEVVNRLTVALSNMGI